MPTTTPEIIDIPTGDLHPAVDNPRRNLGDLTGLAGSIKAAGIIEPLVITSRPEGGYTIVAGHRRHAAAKKARLTSVPCIVRGELTDPERMELMVIENLQREGLAPLEEAAAYQALVDLKWTQRKIADRIGCDQSHVSKRLALMKLPDEARTAIDDGKLKLELAVELTKLDDAQVAKLLKTHGPGGISEYDIRRTVEAAAQQRKHEKAAAPYIKKGLVLLARPDYMKYEQCTERVATHIYFNWNDELVFACEKQEQPKAATPAKPRKETAKEKRERVAREARAASRLAAIAAVVDDDQVDVWPILATELHTIFEPDERVAASLGIPVGDPPAHSDWKARDQYNRDIDERVAAYAAVDSAHARRLVVAILFGAHLERIGQGLAIGLLVEHGYDADEWEMEAAAKARDLLSVARERGYLPKVVRTCRVCGCTEDNACQTLLGPCSWADDDLCTSCLSDAGTTADPDAPATAREVLDAQAKVDRKFVDDNQLQVGDEVGDDGSITRADDVDEISGAAPHLEDNAPEPSNGTRKRTRATAAAS